MIKVPHEKPIRFVNQLINKDENTILVDVTFPFKPTLAMVCEASAQGCAGFAPQDEEAKIGFLVSLKNVELLNELLETDYFIRIKKSFDFGLMTEYIFELENSNTIYAKGTLTIAMQQ